MSSRAPLVDLEADNSDGGLPRPFSDHVYKTASCGPVYARVWASKTAAAYAPFLFYIHGGAFTHGQHTRPRPWQSRGFLDAGCHVVSVAYRLGPHCGLANELEDVLDALAWCRKQLPGLIEGRGGSVNVDRYIVCGDSAGGALCTLMGHYARPRPCCVLDCYGVVDCLTNNEEFSDRENLTAPTLPFTVNPLFTTEEVEREAVSRDSSKALSWCPWNPSSMTPEQAEEQFGTKGTPFVLDDEVKLHFELHEWLGYRHLIHDSALRRDTCKTQEEWVARTKGLSARWLADENYPPTHILHGMADEGVPVQMSYDFAAVLRDLGVEVMEAYVPDAEHVCDRHWADKSHPEWTQYVDPMIAFALRHASAATAE